MSEKEYNVLDLFSGIGGFSLGLQRAGFKFGRHFYSELDKHAIAIYKHNFKGAEYAGPVEQVHGDYDGVIKPVPATQRYKALGNAVTVDVVKAVGESIIETMRNENEFN